MKVVSRFLLLATGVPFLALAKNDSTAKKNDARFLKKPKAPKAPKAAPAPKKSPKATQSPTGSPTNAPTNVPTRAPTNVPTRAPSNVPTEWIPDVEVFYNTEDTLLSEVAVDDDECDSKLSQYFIDLGTVKGSEKDFETMAVLQTSFTTAISMYFHMGSNDDIQTLSLRTDLDSVVLLSILAYSGCDSAEACETAGVTPTPLIPETVSLIGWKRGWYIGYNDGENSYQQNDNRMILTITPPIISESGFVVDDAEYTDNFVSTNEANFILAGKGTGDIFLQAKIGIDLEAYAGLDDRSEVEVAVKEWVVTVQRENHNMKVHESFATSTDDGP